jgi:uncharacterized protein
MRLSRLQAVAVSMVALLILVPQLTRSAAQDGPPVDLLWGVKIPLRDGVHLNATIYKPHVDGPLPVIFALTPYVADAYHGDAVFFARSGYVFAAVDARGRGNSEGSFQPLSQEARDGSDVVAWLAKQTWSDGSVAMYGSSYDGYVQWATAKEIPPNLKTIVPVAAAMPSLDIPFWKNIWDTFDAQWTTLTSGVTANRRLFSDSEFWIQKYRELYLGHRAFGALDTIVGNPSAVFRTWLEHPRPDSFWDACNPTAEQFSRIDLPILTITGYYDDDQSGALEFYRRHQIHGAPGAKERHYLLLGPWDHAGTSSPAKEVGGLVFGETSAIDMNQLIKEWYDWVLKSGNRPGFLKNRVAYYVVGKDEWRYAESLEAIPVTRRLLHLGSDGDGAADVFHSGYLTDRRTGEKSSDSYVYDPLDTRPAGLERVEIEDYLTDERPALDRFGNGLVYHTETFADSTEVTGSPRLVLWMSLDVPDADFQATLYEIQSDGTSIVLAQDRLRARYRESLREEKLVRPGEILKYEFSGFHWFSRCVARGSRLRLVISCPNSIYVQKNYCSGKNVVEETGKDARTAHVTLYHDARHASYLELPVAR